MKIVQIIAAVIGETPGTIDSPLFGLGDDGGLYEFVPARKPLARDKNGKWVEKVEQNPTQFYEGSTVGWRLMCGSTDRATSIPHPLAPI